IGIDIGGTKTLCLLVDQRLSVIDSLKFKTCSAKGEKQFLRNLLKAVGALQKLSVEKRLTLVGVGVACAGQVDCETLEIRSSPNLLRLEGCALGEHLERELKVKVHLRNDVQMGIYGEKKLGAA